MLNHTTADRRPQPDPVAQRLAVSRWHAASLIADGAFLALVGGAQMAFELLSHFFGIGPLGQIFAGSAYTIGFLEAHGLALLIGLLLIRAAAAPHRSWHWFAACIHLLLGGANLLFWDSFVAWGMVPAGVVATAFHGLFLVAQLFWVVQASTRKDELG